MKKIFHILAIAIVIAACNNSAKKNIITPSKAEQQPTDSFAVVTREEKIKIDSLMPGAPQLSIDLDMHFAVSTDKAREANINNAVIGRTFGFENMQPTTAIDSFVKIMREDYLQLRPEYYNEKSINGGGEWFNYNYDISSKVSHGRNDVINYSIFHSSYTGGAHGSNFYTFINFDPQSGKEIKLDDVFKPDYYEALTDRLITALAKEKGAKTLDELQEKGYLILNDMYPTDNFLLKSDSIVFHYNHYDIAPYAMGESDIAFSYEKLKDLLRDEYTK